MNNFSTVKKPRNVIATISLVLLFATCNLFGQKIDKKCNVIYAPISEVKKTHIVGQVVVGFSKLISL